MQHWPENHRPGHGDMTIDDDGQDVMVGISKSPPDKFRVIKRRLSDGRVSELTGPGLAQHVSARNIGLPGWVIVTYGGSAAELRHGFDPLYQEVDAVRLDGSGQILPHRPDPLGPERLPRRGASLALTGRVENRLRQQLGRSERPCRRLCRGTALVIHSPANAVRRA